MKKKKQTREQRYKEALEKIASALKLAPQVRDYENIGRHALQTAKDALYEPCEKCGK